MSNYGNPNGKRPTGQGTSAPSGQSPYMGYQQSSYQTGPAQTGYQQGAAPQTGYQQAGYQGAQAPGGYQAGQNPGMYQSPYQGYGQPQQTGYAAGGQNPYGRPQVQQPYGQGYNQGYTQGGMPYSQPQQPYAAGGYVPYGTQQPYAQQPGYSQGQSPQQPYPGGAYPYQGQTNPPQGGYAQGPYGQGSYPQQGGFRQSPPMQNGQAPKRKKIDLPIEPEWLIVIAGAVVLVGLFAASLLTSLPALKWLFAAFAVISLAYIWLRPVLQPGPKLTASVLIGVALIVTVLSMVLTPGQDRTTDGRTTTDTSLQTAQEEEDLAAAAIEEEGLGAWEDAQSAQVNVPTPTPDTTSATLENLSSFFYFWSVNNIENMLNYCAPSWVRNQEDPKVSLFQVLSNRIAKAYTLGSPTGTDNDVSRTVAVTATVDKQNGDSYSIYVFNVIMLKENDTWYVDPRSLQSHEEVEATTYSAVITQPPTPQPAEASMVLYYNPDGGSYYHADPNCEAVAEKYRPLSGTFTFGQISEPAYADLKCCQRCAAPMRPVNR